MRPHLDPFQKMPAVAPRCQGGCVIGVREVLDAIGSGLLEPVVVEGNPGVRDVVVAEPGDEIHPGDVVLGVGVPAAGPAVELVRRCGAAGAAAVVLRPPAADDPAVRSAATGAGVALLAAYGRVSWAQLVWLLRGVVDTGAAGGPSAAAQAPAFHDLFALA